MGEGKPAAPVPSLLCPVPEEPHMPRPQGSWNLDLLYPFPPVLRHKAQAQDVTEPRSRDSLAAAGHGVLGSPGAPRLQHKFRAQSGTVPAPSGVRGAQGGSSFPGSSQCTGMILFPWILTPCDTGHMDQT